MKILSVCNDGFSLFKWIILLICLIALTGCSSSGGSDKDSSNDSATNGDGNSSGDNGDTGGQSGTLSEQYPNVIIDTTPIDDNLYAAAISPDGALLYISDNDDTSIIVFSTSGKAVVGLIPVPDNPKDLAVTPDGQFLYVAHRDSISVIQTSSRTVVDTLSNVDEGEYRITPSTDSQKVYVYSDNTILEIRASDRTIRNSLSLGSDITDLACSPDGKLLYVSNNQNEIIFIQASGLIIDHAISLNDNNIIYEHISSANQYARNWGLNLCVSADGKHLYASDDYGAILVIDTRNSSVIDGIVIGSHISSLSVPPDSQWIYVTTYNKIFVLQANNHSIIDIFSSKGHLGKIHFSQGGKKAYSLMNDYGTDSISIIGIEKNDNFTSWYRDKDGDSYGDAAFADIATSQPSGFVSNNSDCDDSNPYIFPDHTWFRDMDNDGRSDGTQLTQCLRPEGYKLLSELLESSGDCDDNDPNNWSACNSCRDQDGDGFVGTGCDNNSDPNDMDSAIIPSLNAVVDSATLNDFYGSGDLILSTSEDTLYLTNYLDNTLRVVDTSDLSLIDTISTGQRPTSMAVAPDGRYLYISNYNDNTVSVVRAIDNTITATIEVGDGPTDLSFSHDAHLLYVANRTDGTLSVLDVEANSVIDTIDVDEKPYQLLTSPSGEYVYVAHYETGLLSTVATDSRQVINTVELEIINPRGMVLSHANNRLYISSSGSGNVIAIDTLNFSTEIIETVNASRMCISADSTYLYVVGGISHDSVYVIRITDNTVVDTVPVSAYLGGMALSSESQILYVASLYGTISVIKYVDGYRTWYRDSDGDGYGAMEHSDQSSSLIPPGGWVDNTLDINDGDPSENIMNTWYRDNDNDGYSDGTSMTQYRRPNGFKLASELLDTSGDCNDNVDYIWSTCDTCSDNDGDGFFGTDCDYSFDPDDTDQSIIPHYSEIAETFPVVDNPGSMVMAPNGDYFYLIDDSANSVSIIDKTDGNATDTIPLGEKIYRLAITPNGEYLYAAHYNSISVIQTSNNTTIAELEIDAWNRLVISPDSQYLFAAKGNSISVIEVTGHTTKNAIAVGSSISCLGISSDGSILYVGVSYSAELLAYRLPDATIVDTIPLQSSAQKIITTSKNQFLYVLGSDGIISIFRTSDNTVVGSIPIDSGLVDVEKSPDDLYLYGISSSRRNLFIISTRSNALIDRVSIDGEISSILFSPDEHLGYVLNTSDKEIVALAPSTVPYQTWYMDEDRDGFGNPDSVDLSVSRPYGFVDNNKDCNDGNRNEHPGQVWYKDADNDGRSDGTSITRCTRLETYKLEEELIDKSDGCDNDPNNWDSCGTCIDMDGDGFAGTGCDINVDPDDNNALIVPNLNIVTNTISFDHTYNSSYAMNPTGTVLYKTNRNADAISILRTSDGGLQGSIDIGGQPSSIVLSPDGQFLYVGRSTSQKTISVFRTSDHALFTSINTKSSPDGLAISPDGRYLYVIDEHNNLSAIDIQNNSVVATISIRVSPELLAFSEDGAYLYAANSDESKLSIIQTSDNTLLKTIELGAQNIYGLAVSRDGKSLFISDGNEVLSLSTDDFSVTKRLALEAGGRFLMLSRNGGYLYAASSNPGSGAINVIQTDDFSFVDSIDWDLPAHKFFIDSDGRTMYALSLSGNLATVGYIDGLLKWYRDSDHDGEGDPAFSDFALTQPTGYVSNDRDCNDRDIHENSESVWYRDADNDGYSDGTAVNQCERPEDFKLASELTSIHGDCDDHDPNNWSFCLICTDADGDGFVGTDCNINVDTDDQNPDNTPRIDTIIGTIPGNFDEATIVISPDGRFLYAIGPDLDGVEIIRVSDNGSIGTIQPQWEGVAWNSQLTDIAITPNGQQLYVSSRNDNIVWVFDPVNHGTIGMIPINSPTRICISPDSSRIYVAGQASSYPVSSRNISVIQTADNTLLESIPLDYWPSDVAISGNNQFLFTAINDRILVFETSDYTVVDSIPVEPGSKRISITPEGDYLYVAHIGYNNTTVQVIRLFDNSTVKTIDTRGDLFDITMSSDGKYVYVAGEDLLVFEVATHSVADKVSIYGDVFDVSVLPSGDGVYCANSRGISIAGYGGQSLFTWYRDIDLDGYGDPDYADRSINQPSGYVENDADCDDTDVQEFPGQTWFKDLDQDTYSDGVIVYQCERPDGYKLESELTDNTVDCNDGSNYVWTYCNTCVDNDGDGYVGTGCDYDIDPDDHDASVIPHYNEIVGKMPIDGIPGSMAISPNGQYLYISNIDAKTLVLIDRKDNSVINTILLESQPDNLVITRDGRYICVSHSRSISIVQTSDFTVTATLDVDGSIDLAVSPDSKYLYAADDSLISVVELASHAVVSTMDAVRRIAAISVSSDGKYLYASKRSPNQLLAIQLPSCSVHNTLSLPGVSRDILTTPDGKTVYLHSGSSVIVVETAGLTISGTIPVGKTITEMKMMPGGKYLYCLSGYDKAAFVIQTSDRTIIDKVTGVNGVKDIVFSPDGEKAFISDLDDHAIYILGRGIRPYETWYQDSDHDGFGNPLHADQALVKPYGFVDNGNDCNDENRDEHPGQIWYQDIDNDGYSDGTNIVSCDRPESHKLESELIRISEECNDTDPNNWLSCDACGDNDGDGFVGTLCDNNVDPDDNDSFMIPNPNAVVKTVEIGVERTASRSMTISPSGDFLYIANGSDDTISVVKTSDLSVTAEIQTGSRSDGIIVSPGGHYLYTTNPDDSTVSVIRLTDNANIATLSLAATPSGMAISPDGQLLYVIKHTSKEITVINTNTHSITETFDVGLTPFSIAVSPDGNSLCVTNHDSHESRLIVIRLTDNQIQNTIELENMRYINRMAFSQDGKLLYLIDQSSKVVILETVEYTSIAGLAGVYGYSTGTIASAENGNYLFNLSSNYITVIQAKDRSQADIIHLSGNGSAITVNFDESQLYVLTRSGQLSLIQFVDGLLRWYRDYDHDGYGNALYADQSLEKQTGYVLNKDDCDDNDYNVWQSCREE